MIPRERMYRENNNNKEKAGCSSVAKAAPICVYATCLKCTYMGTRVQICAQTPPTTIFSFFFFPCCTLFSCVFVCLLACCSLLPCCCYLLFFFFNYRSSSAVLVSLVLFFFFYSCYFSVLYVCVRVCVCFHLMPRTFIYVFFFFIVCIESSQEEGD